MQYFRLFQSQYFHFGCTGLRPEACFILVTRLKLTNEKTILDDLKRAGERHEIASLEGFGETSEKQYSPLQSLPKRIYQRGTDTITRRERIAEEVIAYLKECKNRAC